MCQGQKIRPPSLDAKLSCTYLDRGDPALRIGPFKLEPLSDSPYVGLLHQAHHEAELADIRLSARGKMKATPLLIHAKESSQESAYTARRTSKVLVKMLNKYIKREIGCLSK